MKFDFDLNFQLQFLAALLRDAETLFAYRFVIEPTYFGSEAMAIICGALFDYVDKYKALPRAKILAHKIRRDLRRYDGDKETEKITLKVLKKAYDIKLKEIGYVKDLASTFAEDAEWRSTFIEAPDFIEAQDYKGLFDKCLTAREKGRVVLPYVVDKELENRLSRVENIAEEGVIKTGIKHFDLHCKVYPPSFGLIIGDSGKGKTWLLIHLAISAMRQGHNVLFFTGEMSPDDLSVRFDASLLGISTDYFYESELHDKLKPRIKKKYKKLKGSLTIVKFASGMYSVGELDADIRRFRMRDDKPTVILVDFIDLLTYRDSAKRGMSGWEEQIMISRYLQGITHEEDDLVMWAAGTRKTKRPDGEKSNKLATREDKSGAGDIVYALDFYLTLNQSMKDYEQKRILINVDKVKKGEGGWVVGVEYNFARSRFCVKSLGAIQRSKLEAIKERKKNEKI